MNALTIAYVTACTAVIAAVAGPTVSLLVARQQMRATLISTNRERWAEALRDLLAEYVSLVLSGSIRRQVLEQDLPVALSENSALMPTAERVALVKSKILLMIDPGDAKQRELCRAVEDAYHALVSKDRPELTRMRDEAEAITRAGRAVLKVEWHRVKRGD